MSRKNTSNSIHFTKWLNKRIRYLFYINIFLFDRWRTTILPWKNINNNLRMTHNIEIS